MISDLKAAVKRLLKIVYPNRCARCGEVIELDDKFCPVCEKLKIIEPPVCSDCGVQKEFCRCKNRKNEYKQITAAFYYENNIITAVHRFKRDMPFLSRQMAYDIFCAASREYGGIEFDCITYVPMTKKDFKNRGYNQSLLLAQQLSELMGVPLADTLVKIQQTEHQKKQSARERRVNLFGAFDVTDKSYISGKTVLIVDDVKTTGSTLSECAKMLKIYGAKSVYAAVFCVVNNKKEISKS